MDPHVAETSRDFPERGPGIPGMSAQKLVTAAHPSVIGDRSQPFDVRLGQSDATRAAHHRVAVGR